MDFAELRSVGAVLIYILTRNEWSSAHFATVMLARCIVKLLDFCKSGRKWCLPNSLFNQKPFFFFSSSAWILPLCY